MKRVLVISALMLLALSCAKEPAIEAVHNLTPVDVRIGQKAVEHILPAGKHLPLVKRDMRHYVHDSLCFSYRAYACNTRWSVHRMGFFR